MNKPKFNIDVKKNKIVFDVNLKLYDLDIIYGAAYYLVDQMYIYLEETSENDKIKVHLKAKENASKKKLEEIAGKFLNELINVGFRHQISKKNKKIREYIAGAALAGASTEIKSKIKKKNRIKDKECNSKWIKDPEDIAIPWEEKNKEAISEDKKLYKKTADGLVVPWKNKEKD
ncbi:MAG: His-Xaa-Ser system protein HxsD [Candidatus Woesearchaeota archaeon]